MLHARPVLPVGSVYLRPKHNRTVLRPLLHRYGTHRNQKPSSLLTNALDQKVRQAKREDSVGPFQWGLAQPAIDYGEKVEKWNELSTKGKVFRTTARTTNFTVILLGAGLSALLIYTLTTELFSKNSPTVLYDLACEQIKASPLIFDRIPGSLSFHNDPPSVIRPRHRSRHVSYSVTTDSQNREHMFLHFYVHGSDPATAKSDHISDIGYLGALTEWTTEKAASITELSLDDSLSRTKAYTHRVWERWKKAFRYLIGMPISSPPLMPPPEETEQSPEEKKESWWGAAGLFGNLRRNREKIMEQIEGQKKTFTDGEIHAELIRNDKGYFVFRYLFVDFPCTSMFTNPVAEDLLAEQNMQQHLANHMSEFGSCEGRELFSPAP